MTSERSVAATPDGLRPLPSRTYIAGMMRRSHIIGLSLLVVAAVLAAFVAFSPVFERPRMVVSGVADVGGPFTLTAHTGERISDEAFRGQFMLVAFGFTHCPDVCPAELQVMTAALEGMGPEAERVQPLFVTIDPERDTAAHLADYMAHFHPRLIGLTGTADEIAAVAKAYRVWYEKVDDGTPHYLMDHTSITYLMGPDGEFVQHFSFGTSADRLSEALLAAVKS
jgi:cytochrome oxidase Cu insertion factor (SCO1/SenC/PrrC family)